MEIPSVCALMTMDKGIEIYGVGQNGFGLQEEEMRSQRSSSVHGNLKSGRKD